MSFLINIDCNQNKNQNKTINNNYQKIAEEFCKRWYQTMSSNGLSDNLYLFTPTTKCTFDNEEFRNSYDLLVKLSQQGIHKFGYVKCSATCQPIDENVLISVVGVIYPVNFTGMNGCQTIFNDIFILESINGSYYITNYICKLLK